MASKRQWSRADDALIRQWYPHDRTAAIAEMLGCSVASIYNRAHKLGLHKSAAYLASPAACRTNGRQGIGSRFPKGHVPMNKGLRRPGWGPGRMKETQFKRGERRGVAVELYKPIGTERVSKDGYMERKVNDWMPLQRRWRAVHLLLWEAANGPLPKGHAIAFRNGDKTDIRLDNLECIPRAELMARNTVHRLPKPLAEAIQLLGALRRQLQKRTHGSQEQDRRSA